MKEKRLDYFDNIKGLLIILVVFGHLLYEFRNLQIIESILRIIYIFHMPAFIFVSGYFSKSEKSRGNESLFKLLFYYLVGNTILMWFSFIAYKTPFNLIEPYYSFWYLIVLIVYRKVIKYVESYKLLLPISIFIALMIGGFSEINNVFALSRIICFFPFFILGYKLKDKYINKLLEKRNLILYIFSIIFLFILFLFSVIFVSNISLDDTMMMPYTSDLGIVYRSIIIVIALFFILGIFLVIPKKRIPFITSWGKNSLYIFLYHRILILILVKFINPSEDLLFYLIVSIILTIIICLITGSDSLSEFTYKGYIKLKNILMENKLTTRKVLIGECCLFVIIVTLCVPFIKVVDNNLKINKKYNVISAEEERKIKNSVSLLFTGDLILLKNQIERGYNKDTSEYDFNSVFDYTKKYIDNADFSVGVFEGPMAGKDRGYSTSNFDDGIDLYLNFPDEFGTAIKNAGFDLVTLSNNHILDQGKKGAYKTTKVLDDLNIKHTGVYKNRKDNIQILEKDGLRIGFLSYTFSINGYDEERLVNQNITSVLVDENSKYFKKVRKQVKNDFNLIKKENVDTIVVLPHMGTQFTNYTDDLQKTWNNIFIDNGADIIVGDHSHSVQPIEFSKAKNGKDVIIVNSLGNFVNSYTEHDGDATSMIEIYIDKDTGKLNGSSLIPMWTTSFLDGNYQALPIYEILNNKELAKKISTYELKRIEEVYKLETNVMLNSKLSLNNVEEKLYLDKDGYKRKKVKPLEISDEERNSKLYKEIDNASSVCFIGDSITEGTKNGGYAWYEPLMNTFNNKKIIDVSKGGATVKSITKKYNGEKADLYIIEIGTNDIRYRNSLTCSMNEEEYINNLEKLIKKIPNSDKANFVFVAPWLSLPNDPYVLDKKENNNLLDKFRNSLEKFCNENNYLYINPNNIIEDVFRYEDARLYLTDYIHPNSTKGIELYSRAVLDSSF